MKYTVAKNSLRRSKFTYYLLYSELQIKRYQFHKLNRSADVTTDISNAAVPMQNHYTKPGWTMQYPCKTTIQNRVNEFASSRG
jgi:hypothetical protein